MSQGWDELRKETTPPPEAVARVRGRLQESERASRSKGSSLLIWAGATAAVSAGVALAVVGLTASPRPVPEYTPEALRGGVATTRAARPADEPPRFEPDSVVTLVVRPTDDVPDAGQWLRADLWARTPDGRTRWLARDLAPSAAGTFRVSAKARQWFGRASGRWTLVLDIARRTTTAPSGPPPRAPPPGGLRTEWAAHYDDHAMEQR